MEYLLFFIIVLLLIFIGWREHANDKKYHDMLDRLMAKNLEEYKSETKPSVQNEEKPKDETQELEDSYTDITEVLNDDK